MSREAADRHACARSSASGSPGPLWLAVAAALLVAPAAGRAESRWVPIDGQRVAALSSEGDLFLEAFPGPGEGLLAFTRRLCGGEDAVPVIAASNGGARKLLAGVRYRVPFELLVEEQQVAVVGALFREDRPLAHGWDHQVEAPEESLWRLARWFTGRGENHGAIRERNTLAEDDLQRGQRVVIPASLLRPALRRLLPEAPAFQLEYGRDEDGEHAVYRLREGEALYSSVVVRFTGRVFADDVNALAGELAAFNGIRDVTDIPVGFSVRVPLDLLLPEFLPPEHPRRREYEESRLASAGFSNEVRARHLEGVTVVLDAGHGGVDVGASSDGVWESLYVYDVVLRLKRLLEATTAARVLTTTRDGSDFQIEDRDVLPSTRGHTVLTDPPYPIADSTVGVHLRWYLANSVFRRTLREGAEANKVVFLSIHADSLHPSLRGAMVYIPAAALRGGAYTKAGTVYASRREVREGPTSTFDRRELLESEGLSRQFASRLIEAFRGERLAVHPYQPVRDRVIRRHRAWVPAVLRYNAVPAKALVEICNLANAEDRRLIQTREFRQRVTEAIARGILAYYGHEVESASRLASAGG